MSPKRGPVIIELDDDVAAETPAEAPPVPEVVEPAPEGRTMQSVAAFASRPVSRLARWLWGLLVSLVGVVISIAAWDFVTGLLARSPVLGGIVTGLIGAFLLVLLGLALREFAAFGRLRRLDGLQNDTAAALASGQLSDAQQVTHALQRLYRHRDDTRWGRDRLAERQAEIVDADTLLALAEETLLSPLDAQVVEVVQSAARQVATVTAIVPLAFADVAVALTANIRMIRRIAEIYGGRSGAFGSWRLTRTVLTHLVATGAVAVGDDLIGSIAGGGVLSKISRRFGEGVINGALTARVGIAAMEVCRPMPFVVAERPKVTGLVRRALAGLFSRGEG